MVKTETHTETSHNRAKAFRSYMANLIDHEDLPSRNVVKQFLAVSEATLVGGREEEAEN